MQEVEAAVACGEFGRATPLSAEERDIYRHLLHALAPGEASCLDGIVTREEADDILFRMTNDGFYSPVKRISGLIS